MKIYIRSLVIVLLVSMVGCQDPEEKKEEPIKTFPVVEVINRTVTSYNSYPATIEGTINSAVRAKVPGYITGVLVDEGEPVSVGQTLFRLETETLSQDAEASLAEVNAARVEVEKLLPLVEKDIISPIQLQTARARLAQAESRHKSVTANIGYATIKSPVDGYVGSINFRSGALVAPGDALPLTTVSQTREVYAFFSMNESDYFTFLEKTEGNSLQEKLENFPRVQLILAGDRIYPHPGEIKTVNAQVNRQTGTVSFRATFPNPEGILANGNSGTIRVPKVYENALIIPSRSTYEAQGYVYAYQLTSGDTVKRTLVEVEDRLKGIYVINRGLSAGDIIMGEGVSRVDDNERINPRLTEFDSIAVNLETFFN